VRATVLKTKGGAVAYVLEVPTNRWPLGRVGLWRHYTFDVGQTLVKEGGVWSVVQQPSQDRLAAAEGFYRGGYAHTVSNAVGEELAADGFGEYLTYVPEPLLFNSPVVFNLDVAFNSPTY
jgi:hypothetical protein